MLMRELVADCAPWTKEPQRWRSIRVGSKNTRRSWMHYRPRQIGERPRWTRGAPPATEVRIQHCLALGQACCFVCGPSDCMCRDSQLRAQEISLLERERTVSSRLEEAQAALQAQRRALQHDLERLEVAGRLFDDKCLLFAQKANELRQGSWSTPLCVISVGLQAAACPEIVGFLVHLSMAVPKTSAVVIG